MNHLWLGMNLRDAIAAPIVFVDADNNLKFEPGFDEVNHLCSHSLCPIMTLCCNCPSTGYTFLSPGRQILQLGNAPFASNTDAKGTP